MPSSSALQAFFILRDVTRDQKYACHLNAAYGFHVRQAVKLEARAHFSPGRFHFRVFRCVKGLSGRSWSRICASRTNPAKGAKARRESTEIYGEEADKKRHRDVAIYWTVIYSARGVTTTKLSTFLKKTWVDHPISR